ncbi:hypothetical protein HLB10_14900 [Cellulomonas fimi]|nr:hypothetical protein [Cellulomonas fimi]
MVLVGAAAVVLTGVAVVVGPALTDRGTDTAPPAGAMSGMFPLPAAAAGDARCLTDVLRGGGGYQQPARELLDTPGLDAAARTLRDVEPVRLGIEVSDFPCGQAVPAAVFYAPDGSGGISLYPDVADPWPGLQAPDDLTVRGQSGRTLSPDAGHHFVTWVEPDGTRWFVVANGLDVPALTAWLDTVPLSGTTVAPDATAPGMQRVADQAAPAPGPSRVIAWDLGYGDAEPVDADGDGYDDGVPAGVMSLHVEVGAAEPVESALSWAIPGRQVTTLDGRVAVWSSGHEGGSALRWSDGTRTYLLMGAPTLDDALALAQTVQPVALDDPRVVALLG